MGNDVRRTRLGGFLRLRADWLPLGRIEMFVDAYTSLFGAAAGRIAALEKWVAAANSDENKKCWLKYREELAAGFKNVASPHFAFSVRDGSLCVVPAASVGVDTEYAGRYEDIDDSLRDFLISAGFSGDRGEIDCVGSIFVVLDGIDGKSAIDDLTIPAEAMIANRTAPSNIAVCEVGMHPDRVLVGWNNVEGAKPGDICYTVIGFRFIGGTLDIITWNARVCAGSEEEAACLAVECESKRIGLDKEGTHNMYVAGVIRGWHMVELSSDYHSR